MMSPGRPPCYRLLRDLLKETTPEGEDLRGELENDCRLIPETIAESWQVT